MQVLLLTQPWLLLCLCSLVGALGCPGTDCGARPPEVPAANDLGFADAVALRNALEVVQFEHSKASENLSDLVATSLNLLAVVSDEGTELGFVDVASERARGFDVLPWLGLEAGAVDELDLEGVAVLADRLVLCGSGSLKRKKPKPGADNVRRLSEIEPASGPGSDASDQVLILRMSGSDLSTLTLTPVEHWNLRQRLLAIPMLAPFREVPSKDNGIDVEAVAADEEHLYFGLRGPVLRGHALVLRTDWHGNEPQLSFLQLSGLGVRGLSRGPEGRGFYVLAGPTMELDGPFAIYAWDGKRSAFGADGDEGLRRLMGVLTPVDASPEGVFVWGGSLCVLSDGLKAGAPRCLSGKAPF